MQAPAAALLVTQLLLDHQPEIDITPFGFARFAKGSVSEKPEKPDFELDSGSIQPWRALKRR